MPLLRVWRHTHRHSHTHMHAQRHAHTLCCVNVGKRRQKTSSSTQASSLLLPVAIAFMWFIGILTIPLIRCWAVCSCCLAVWPPLSQRRVLISQDGCQLMSRQSRRQRRATLSYGDKKKMKRRKTPEKFEAEREHPLKAANVLVALCVSCTVSHLLVGAFKMRNRSTEPTSSTEIAK